MVPQYTVVSLASQAKDQYFHQGNTFKWLFLNVTNFKNELDFFTDQV
jgi:Gpi18-like mannosyltransferase